AAGIGQILVAAPSRRAAGPRFAWAGQSELRVKGRAAPVVAANLAGAAAPGSPVARQAPRAIVGRAAELAVLRERIDQALRGRGQLVAIHGEVGIGKSTLAVAALGEASARGFLCLSGECHSYRAASSYLAWRPVLRTLLGLDPAWVGERQAAHLERRLAALDPRLGPRMPLLGPILGLGLAETALTAGLEGEARKAATEALVCDLIALAPAPLAIAIEGCDWIDPLARDLLVAVARRAAGLPVLIALTYRGAPDEREQWIAPLRGAGLHHMADLRLGELGRPAVEALVAAAVARHFGPEAIAPLALVDMVAARSQGNPLFVEELLALVRDRGTDLADTGAVAGLELPDSLHSLLLSRIDRLDESAQTALKVASVIGNAFSPSWLAGVHPPLAEGAHLDRQLETLRRSDMAVLDRALPEPSYMFRHVLTREVAYNSLARATRLGLHERAGAYIEQAYAGDLERHLDLLAYHYGLSDNQIKQREYFHRAGMAAQAAFASEAAAGFYERLLPLLHRGERSATLLCLGEVLRHGGRYEQAAARFREALALAPDHSTAGRARLALGALETRRSEYGAARQWLEQSRADFARAHDRAGDGEALEQLGMVAWYTGDYGAALDLLEQALAHGGGAADPRRTAQLLNNVGLVYWARQELGRALDCFERGLRAATEAGNRQHVGVTVGNIGNVHLARGDYGKALDCYLQKLQCALDIGDRMELGICIGNIGTIYESEGDYTRAALCFTRALELALDLGDRLGVGMALWSLGTAAMGEGRLSESERLLEQSAALLGAIDATYELCACRASQAELAARRGDYGAALALLG
ncbi:MAG: tetratricopeptide repeat protein, partial [Chloroflexales bacterium]|nr:tetratricopeptide repeat protein [Chloroflexales bacterium]